MKKPSYLNEFVENAIKYVPENINNLTTLTKEQQEYFKQGALTLQQMTNTTSLNDAHQKVKALESIVRQVNQQSELVNTIIQSRIQFTQTLTTIQLSRKILSNYFVQPPSILKALESIRQQNKLFNSYIIANTIQEMYNLNYNDRLNLSIYANRLLNSRVEFDLDSPSEAEDDIKENILAVSPSIHSIIEELSNEPINENLFKRLKKKYSKNGIQILYAVLSFALTPVYTQAVIEPYETLIVEKFEDVSGIDLTGEQSVMLTQDTFLYTEPTVKSELVLTNALLESQNLLQKKREGNWIFIAVIIEGKKYEGWIKNDIVAE